MFLTLSDQQYFVWDTASQSTRRQKMLEIWGHGFPWLRLWMPGSDVRSQVLNVQQVTVNAAHKLC